MYSEGLFAYTHFFFFLRSQESQCQLPCNSSFKKGLLINLKEKNKEAGTVTKNTISWSGHLHSSEMEFSLFWLTEAKCESNQLSFVTVGNLHICSLAWRREYSERDNIFFSFNFLKNTPVVLCAHVLTHTNIGMSYSDIVLWQNNYWHELFWYSLWQNNISTLISKSHLLFCFFGIILNESCQLENLEKYLAYLIYLFWGKKKTWV